MRGSDHKVSSRSRGLLSWLVFLLGFMVPLLGLLAGPSHAQPTDTLSQIQQQLQQRGGGTSGALSSDQSAAPSSVILQPAVPPLLDTQLQTSRLEQIMSARAHVKLTQFGYDQLGRASSVRVPQTGAVQDNYILGPGDEIAVSLRGQENSEIRATVNRDGQVILPRLGPISATGRTLGDFRRDLQAAVHRAYVATDAYVSVARLRQISVLVSGAVNNPGQRLLTGLNSVVDALLISGGVKKTGSLRDVEVQRQGRTLRVDLYSVLTGGGNASDFHLTDGDRIVVQPLGETVAVTGLVRRPGIYELPPGRSSLSVRDLLALAGGQEVRGQFRMSILKILPDGRSALTPVSNQTNSVDGSEILYVQMAADQTINQAVLAGGTGLAGNYPVTSGTHLSDFLKAPGAMGPSPYTPFGIIVRKDPKTLMRKLVAFTPVAVLNGREDQILQSDDMVRILSVHEVQLLNHVLRLYMIRLAQDQDRIRNPLSATVDTTNTLINKISEGNKQGLELADLSSVPASTQRQEIIGLLNEPAPGSPLAQQRAENQRRLAQTIQARQQAAASAQAGQQASSALGGAAVAGSQPGYAQQPGSAQQGYPGAAYPGVAGAALPAPGTLSDFGVAGGGTIGPDGTYQAAMPQSVLEKRDHRGQDQDQTQNFVEQSVASGGFASNREVQTFGQLARQLNIDPLVLVNFLLDHRVQLDGAVRGPGSYFAGPNATLEDLVEAAGGTVGWADESGVELISTMVDQQSGRSVTSRKLLPLRKGMLARYVVQPNDHFRFSQVLTDVGIGSVTIQGEVRDPGAYSILRGEHLSDLLKRAGGLTSTAYPLGTVFLRKSAAQLEQDGYARAADEVEDQLMVAMTRVGNSKLTPDVFTSMQTFVKDLRTRQALGRISIVADPKKLAADPAADPLLQAGDVVYVPPRPSTVAVLGQVSQPGNFTYRANATIEDYVERAGGYKPTADEDHTYIVLPNGEARRVTRSWLSFNDVAKLPAGSAIVVPRDITPLDLRQTIIDVSQVFSQFAVSIASVAVLSTR